MKKITLFILFIVFVITGGWARPRSYSEIQEIAQKQLSLFFDASTRSHLATSGTLIPASQILASESTRSTKSLETESFYVFSVGGSGFVIVSGDDQMKPVLAYSDTGNFILEGLPTNIRSWLQFYDNEFRRLLLAKDKKAAICVATATNRDLPESMPPLLPDIKWDQGAPFNNYCPEYRKEKTVTGCVATAMAQVMKYYNYPESGRYSKNYTTKALALNCSKDFSSVTFQWDKMLPSYGGPFTAENADAVAELMLCCGISVEMDYNIAASGGSGAFDVYVPDALINYFQYNANLQFLLRDYYSYTEWVSILKTEINARRPVIYGGTSSTAGHEFIIDGYDKAGLFHLNWGWSGANNGYFEISSLNPSAPGIGGGSGEDGFNTRQSVVIGIQKETVDKYVSNFLLSSPISVDRSSISRTGSFAIQIPELYNYGASFTGQVRPLLYKEGVPVAELGKAITFKELLRGWGVGVSSNLAFKNLTIPSSIESGDYQLYIAAKDQRETDWSLAKAQINDTGYYHVHITDSKITFASSVVAPDLQTLSVSAENQLYTNKTGNYKVIIKNKGKECSATFGLALQPVAKPDISPMLVATVKTFILSGEEKELSLSAKVGVTAGEYDMLPVYSLDGENWCVITMEKSVKVTVLPEPDKPALLSLLKPVEVNKEITVGEPLTMILSLKNSGAVYDGKLAAAIFEKEGSGYSVDIAFKPVFIDAGETKTVTISIIPNVAVGDYEVSLRYYMDQNGYDNTLMPTSYSQFDFRVKDISSGIPESAESEKIVIIYPQPVEDHLNIEVAKDVSRLEIINSSGQVVKQMRTELPMGKSYVLPVSELASGFYLLRLYTTDKIYTAKFIKK